jgi:hypothetical protein
MARQSQYLEQRKIRKINRYFSFFLGFLVFLGIGCFLIFAKYFLIKDLVPKIDFSRKDILEQSAWEMVSKKKFWLIPENNIFFLDKKQAVVKLKLLFPEIKNLSLDYDFANQTLYFNGELRQAAVKVCQDLDCFFVDFSGIAFRAEDKMSPFLLLEDKSLKQVELGKQFLPKKMINFAHEFKRLVANYIELEKIVIEKEYLEAGFLKLQTKEGWYMLIDFGLDPELIFQNLRLVIEKQIKNSRSRIEYIDLRYPNKAYYMLR